jgi:hypothetical protein
MTSLLMAAAVGFSIGLAFGINFGFSVSENQYKEIKENNDKYLQNF